MSVMAQTHIFEGLHVNEDGKESKYLLLTRLIWIGIHGKGFTLYNEPNCWPNKTRFRFALLKDINAKVQLEREGCGDLGAF